MGPMSLGRTLTTKMTLNVKGEEQELKVTYTYYKGIRGHRNSMGIPEEPDEPPRVEINEVLIKGDKLLLELTDEELDSIETMCLEGFDDDLAEYYSY